MIKLFKKLTNNYRLSMLVACIVFTVTCAFCSIYKVKSFLSYLTQYYFVVSRNVLVTSICCLVFGCIVMALLILFTKLFFGVFKIYTISQREAVFVSLLIFSARNLLLGCLNLLIVFMPHMIVFAKLFFLVTTMAAWAAVYMVYDKYYLHVSVAPAFFKLHFIYWGVITLVSILSGFLF